MKNKQLNHHHRALKKQLFHIYHLNWHHFCTILIINRVHISKKISKIATVLHMVYIKTVTIVIQKGDICEGGYFSRRVCDEATTFKL